MSKMIRLVLALIMASSILGATLTQALAAGTTTTHDCVAPGSQQDEWSLTAEGSTEGGSVTVDGCAGDFSQGGGP